MAETKAESMAIGDSSVESKDLNQSKESNVTTDETPSRSKDLSKTLPEEAFNNFIQGKRHMLVQDYTFAVQSLAVACELYVKHFGELALECGEVYFLYGKSLIRLSQQQSGILGDAINKVPTVSNDDEDGESSDEDENENESGDENKGKESDDSKGKESDDSKGKESDDSKGKESDDSKDKESYDCKEKDNDKGKNGSAPEDDETEEKEPSESTDSPQQVETEVDSKVQGTEPSAPEADVTIQNESNADEAQPEEDDLELAWNVLETAKSIFLRQGESNAEAQLKIAEILQLLAEISMETDNYPAAINDLTSCLCIQQKHLPQDDRLLAHTYYEMGLAHMLQKMYDGALENFTKTKEIFELRKENLKNTPITETVGGFEAVEKQKEIEDIDSIINDIKEKIDDTKELVRNAKNEIQEALFKKEKEIEVDFGKKELDSLSKPVSNITHLLKRKKPDEEEKESESKRIKISPTIPNGDSTVVTK